MARPVVQCGPHLGNRFQRPDANLARTGVEFSQRLNLGEKKTPAFAGVQGLGSVFSGGRFACPVFSDKGRGLQFLAQSYDCPVFVTGQRPGGLVLCPNETGQKVFKGLSVNCVHDGLQMGGLRPPVNYSLSVSPDSILNPSAFNMSMTISMIVPSSSS